MRTARGRIRDEQGVTNVVSLIMIGGIIISLLGMIFSTYLPAWGKDIEAQTQKGTMDSFMDLKSDMDILAVGGDTGSALSSKISLGSNGGPVFGFGRMSGSLQLTSNIGLMEVRDQTGSVYAQGRGSLVYTSNNLYVEDQIIALEGGAIIRDQMGSGILKGTPNIVVRRDVNMGTLSLYVLVPTIEGATQSYSGTSTYMMSTVLMSEQKAAYNIGANDISLSISSNYPNVWTDYLTTMCTSQGLTLGIQFTIVQGVDALLNPMVTITFLTLDRMEIRNAIYQLNVS
ncbi:MAG: hypothetical protein MUC62_09875 [Candidatus Thermoplasmatota archaeon]|jgi:hypothetical protein|nr:hypothetical protein [Candidatus Thermoplasmatota archaeon]